MNNKQNFSHYKKDYNAHLMYYLTQVFFPSFSVTVNYPSPITKSSCSLLCLHDSINITLYKNTSTFTLPYVWWFSFFWFSRHITAIINDRFFSGTFPGAFIVATFSAPSLKKLLCGSNSIANYHAISNLLFLGKVLEKILCSLLSKHLVNNNLFDCFQVG